MYTYVQKNCYFHPKCKQIVSTMFIYTEFDIESDKSIQNNNLLYKAHTKQEHTCLTINLFTPQNIVSPKYTYIRFSVSNFFKLPGWKLIF